MTAAETTGSLDGKAALVTGASRRLGRSTALGLARMGADLIVHARAPGAEIEETAALVRATGRKATVVTGDVSDEAAVARFMPEAIAAHGRLDILINNAAIRRQVDFVEMSFAEWSEILGVILSGAFLCSRAAMPALIKSGDGVIVNIGGLSAHIGAKRRAHVCAAKAGIVGLTKGLAMEFAEAGLRVNCVAPGKIGGQRSATSGDSPAMLGAHAIPLGREGEVDEPAAMVCALCGPAGRFMTGQTVHVSGGLYAP